MPEPKGRNIAPLLRRPQEEEEQEQAPGNRSGRNVAAMLGAQSEAKDSASPTHVMGIRLPTDEDFAQAEERQAAQFAEFDAELERMGQRIIDRKSSDPENIGWAPSQKRYKHPMGGDEFTIYTPQEFAAAKLGRLDGAMLSWGDEIYGMVNKEAGDRRRALKRYAEEKYPNQYAWGEGDGATFNAVATMPVGLKAADKVVASIPKIGTTTKAAITGALSASAWDGTDQLGGGEGDLLDRAGQYDPVRGGVAAGLGGTLGGTISKVAEGVSGLVDKVRSPDLDGLRALKDAAYKEAEGLGVEYSPESFTDLVAKIEGALDEMEIEPMAHQKVLGVLTRLQKRVTGDPISMMRLDKMRQAVRKQLNGPGATDTDKMFGRLIIDEIDEFIDSGIGAAAGIGKKGAEAIRKARGLHTVFKKTELLEDAYETAALRASSTGSGGNFENALRQEMRKIYQSKKLNASFSTEELKVMRQVIDGAPIQKLFRAYGKMDPFKHGLASMFASANVGNAVFSGGSTASLLPLAFQAGAIPARMAGEALAAGKFDKLARTVRRGANAYTNRAEEMAQAMGGTTGGGFGREARSLEEGIEQASRGQPKDTMAEAMNGPQVAPQRPVFGRRAPDDPVQNGLPAFNRTKPGVTPDVPAPGSKGSGIQMQLKDGRPTTIGKIYELATSINPETNQPWTRAEIADEMMISKNQVSVTYHKLRKAGYSVDVVPSVSAVDTNAQAVGVTLSKLRSKMRGNGEVVDFGMGLALPTAAASMMLTEGESSEEEMMNLLGTEEEKRAAMARAMLGGF